VRTSRRARHIDAAIIICDEDAFKIAKSQIFDENRLNV